jgi:hypothetical protein
MTGKELTERLIADIRKSATNRKTLQDPMQLIENIGNNGKVDLEKIMSSFNVTSFDERLGILTQFINTNERLVNQDKGSKIDIDIYQRDVENNLEAISEIFQYILDGNIANKSDSIPISKLLIDQLQYLNESAS